MTRWKRIKSALEWGLFYGIITWLATTAITSLRNFPTAGVWGIILSRMLMGFLLGYFTLKMPWWLQGILAGIVVNAVFGIFSLIPGVIKSFFSGWVIGFWLMLISGMIIGVLIMISLRRRPDHTVSSQ